MGCVTVWAGPISNPVGDGMQDSPWTGRGLYYAPGLGWRTVMQLRWCTVGWRDGRGWGMTVPELALAMGVLGVVLVLLAGLIRHVRNDAKAEQSRRLLLALDEAIGRYQAAHGSYPPGSEDLSSAACLAALEGEAAAWEAVQSVSPLLVGESGEEKRCFRDGWGTPVRYLTGKGARKARERVRIHGGRPIFESAGPDRNFGDGYPASLPDNLATDYLGMKQ